MGRVLLIGTLFDMCEAVSMSLRPRLDLLPSIVVTKRLADTTAVLSVSAIRTAAHTPQSLMDGKVRRLACQSVVTAQQLTLLYFVRYLEFDTGRGRVIEYAPDNWEESTSSPSPPSSPSQDINVKREPFENSVAAKQEPLEALLVKQEAVEMPLVKLEEEEGELPVRARSWSRCPLSNRLQRLQV